MQLDSFCSIGLSWTVVRGILSKHKFIFSYTASSSGGTSARSYRFHFCGILTPVHSIARAPPVPGMCVHGAHYIVRSWLDRSTRRVSCGVCAGCTSGFMRSELPKINHIKCWWVALCVGLLQVILRFYPGGCWPPRLAGSVGWSWATVSKMRNNSRIAALDSMLEPPNISVVSLLVVSHWFPTDGS